MTLSQISFAERVGISNSVLSRIESGKRPMEDSEIIKFADFLDVSADYILGRTNSLTGMNAEKDWTEEEEQVALAAITAWRKMKE
jgi:transcriptional regulator with XRE-family HTH domain